MKKILTIILSLFCFIVSAQDITVKFQEVQVKNEITQERKNYRATTTITVRAEAKTVYIMTKDVRYEFRIVKAQKEASGDVLLFLENVLDGQRSVLEFEYQRYVIFYDTDSTITFYNKV